MRVGIDLGTTYSAVAYVNPVTKRPEIIKNRYQNRCTPSIIAFVNDEIIYGEEALGYMELGQVACVSHFKRQMGSADYLYEVKDKTYTAVELSAILLKGIIKEAEESLEERITEAVITVPAYFGHKERKATIEAAKKAGIKVLHIINEPAAAALAYGMGVQKEKKTLLVYDLGGGTFDAAVVKMEQGNIRILGSDGDHELGGKEWDDMIARYLSDCFYSEHGIDLTMDPGETAHILCMAENMKKRLSAANRAECTINYKGKRGHYSLTEDAFRRMSEPLLKTTKMIVNRLLSSVDLSFEKIDGVLLAGGSTKMRMVREYLQDASGDHIVNGVSSEEAVALGAAVRAAMCEEESKALLPDLNQEKKEEFRFEDRIPGAKRLVDTTAHSLGMISISLDGKYYVNSILIKKNTPIPASNTRSYKLVTNFNYNELLVYIVQGEQEDPLLCDIIGKYIFSGIRKEESGEALIHVTYSYTAEGIIEVSAIQEGNSTPLSLCVKELEKDFSWIHEVPDLTSAKLRKKAKGCLYLAVDLSGSMSGAPLLEAKKAMLEFVGRLDKKRISVGMIGFADKVETLLLPTKDQSRIEQAVANIRVDGVRLGYGNGANPFAMVYESSHRRKEEEDYYLVVLTDGVWTYKENAIKEAKKCIDEGIEIHALGFGSADEEFIDQIVSKEEYKEMTELKDLTKSFTKIAQSIT